MPQEAGRKHQPMAADTGWFVAGGLIGFIAVIACMYLLSLYVDPAIREAAGSSNVQTLIVAQITGIAPMTALQIGALVGQMVLLLALAGLILFVWRKNRGTRTRVDERAKDMTRIKDMAELGRKAAQKDAERLDSQGAGIGVPLGKLVNNMQSLWASWEWVQIWIMGPRAGKTSCVCVPQILETDGPVLATSNKRDIVDLTRGPRSAKGRVWVHDAQDIIGEDVSSTGFRRGSFSWFPKQPRVQSRTG